MGLYSYFDANSCGLPNEVTASDVGYPEVDDMVDPIEVDYSPAVKAMVATFMEIATTLVPVDTGYLKSTIHAHAEGPVAEFFADAEYAEYVEYGTSKMGAQPYFEPALDEAIEVFITEAMQAYTQAAQMMQNIVQSIVSAMMEAVGNMIDGGFGGFTPMGLGQMSAGAYYGGLALSFLFLWLSFPILVNLYGIMSTLMAPFDPMEQRIYNLKTNGIEIVII